MTLNPAQIDAVLSGRRTDFRAVGLRLLLGCASPFYGAAASLNQMRFDWNLAAVHRVSAPVISVGNITTGGTGKTPFTAWLVRTLQKMGKSPGIASRGYKSLDSAHSIEADQQQGNDEKMVLEQLCPGTPHLQNRDRVLAARRLIEQHNCDCVILDDGFQHRRLHRDLNLVLIDAVNPFGYNHLLPRGLLREPLGSLKRADLIVITRVEQVPAAHISQIRAKLKRYIHDGIPIVEVAFEPTFFLDRDGNRFSLSKIPQTAIMFCGIGNPSGFQNLLSQIGLDPSPGKNFFIFPDHHHYTKQEVQTLCNRARKAGTKGLLTTQKDLVKLGHLLPDDITCQAVCIDAVVKNAEEILLQKLKELF